MVVINIELVHGAKIHLMDSLGSERLDHSTKLGSQGWDSTTGTF